MRESMDTGGQKGFSVNLKNDWLCEIFDALTVMRGC